MTLPVLLRRSWSGLTDATVTFGGRAATAVAGLLTSILLARGLPAGEFGTYALVASVVMFMNGLTDMGLTQTATRFGARAVKQDDEPSLRAIVRWALRLRFALAALAAMGGVLLGPPLARSAWHAPDVAAILPIAMLAPVAIQLGANVPPLLQARGLFGRNTVAVLVTSGFSLVGLLCVIGLDALSVRAVVIASVVATAASGLAQQWLVPPSVRVWNLRREETALPGDIAPFARLMVVTAVTTQLLLSADVWILGAIVAREEVASYSVAARFTVPLSLGMGALGVVLWPRIGSSATDAGASRSLASRLVRLSALGSGPILLYSLAAPLLAPAIFGDHYRASVVIGQVLCLRYVIALFGTIFVGIGYNVGLGSLYPLINVGRVLILAAAARLLGPSLGPMALAVGLVLGEGFLTLAAGLLVRRRFRDTELRPSGA